MKKNVSFFVLACFMVLVLVVPAESWTGRMAGMGNPYGLVEDESDFLTHPTAITQGKGWQYYGDFGINYTKVTKWDYSGAETSIYGLYSGTESFSVSGHDWNANASAGFTFPVNTGRMGVFFGYSGNILSRGKYSGSLAGMSSGFGGYYQERWQGSADMKNDVDHVALRVLYAQPFTDKVKFGGEFQLSWKKEKNSTMRSYTEYDYEDGYLDEIDLYSHSNGTGMLPLMIPYDTTYYEALLKGSVEAAIGSSKLNFSPYFGFIFGGENKWNYGYTNTDDPGMWYQDTYGEFESTKGSISGWKIGAETWWRFPVRKGFSLPFVLKAEYGKIKRSGDGPGFWYRTDESRPVEYGTYGPVSYENDQKYWNVLVGGGMDMELAKGSRIAAGLYYNYLYSNNTFSRFWWDPLYDGGGNYSKVPETKEHRIIARMAGEFAITPKFALTTGLNFFYGWVKANGAYNDGDDSDMMDSSSTGHQWGISGAIGGVFKVNGVSLEPYIAGGYQSMKVSGSGYYLYKGMPESWMSQDAKKTQWNIGGGLSVKFN